MEITLLLLCRHSAGDEKGSERETDWPIFHVCHEEKALQAIAAGECIIMVKHFHIQ